MPASKSKKKTKKLTEWKASKFVMDEKTGKRKWQRPAKWVDGEPYVNYRYCSKFVNGSDGKARRLGKARIGSKLQVFRGCAKQTAGGLTRQDLKRVNVSKNGKKPHYRIRKKLSNSEKEAIAKRYEANVNFKNWVEFSQEHRAQAVLYAEEYNKTDLTTQQAALKFLGKVYRKEMSLDELYRTKKKLSEASKTKKTSKSKSSKTTQINGKDVVIPSEFVTSKGKINKNKKKQYNAWREIQQKQ